ncbi:MAG: hypothetical protein JWQ01_4838 [Massilia sp.]|nr:hypothetical protein [Massilia sp.]
MVAGGEAMSAQSLAKAAQGYVAKAIPQTCMNCAHFAVDAAVNKFGWVDEKNLRCTLGNFAVKKMAACNQFAPKVAA